MAPRLPQPPGDLGRRSPHLSLAFNLTTVDTTDEMGPFEVAPWTQWERGDGFDHEQFPPQSEYARYEGLAQRKFPRNDAHHDLAVTKSFWDTLPERVRDHLSCPILDVLTPITQKHDIEGLVMG